jgi:hypothetical protein
VIDPSPSRRLGATAISLFVLSMIIAGCESPAPVAVDRRDLRIVQATNAAQTAFDQGDLGSAANLYQRALDRARALDASNSIVDAAIALAICKTESGDDSSAAPLLLEAGYESDRAGGYRHDEVTLLRARLAYRQKQLDQARTLATALVADPKASMTVRAQAHVLLGELACDDANAVAADKELAAATIPASANPPPMLAADSNRLQGRVELLHGQAAKAGQAFDREAETCGQMGIERRVTAALGRAGDAYAAAGQRNDAADRYYRAARSAAGHGDLALARNWLKLADADATDPRLRELIAQASAQISAPPVAT